MMSVMWWRSVVLGGDDFLRNTARIALTPPRPPPPPLLVRPSLLPRFEKQNKKMTHKKRLQKRLQKNTPTYHNTVYTYCFRFAIVSSGVGHPHHSGDATFVLLLHVNEDAFDDIDNRSEVRCLHTVLLYADVVPA